MDRFEESIEGCLVGDEKLTSITTRLFNLLQDSENEILVENFDDEQVFQQIEHLYTNSVVAPENIFDCLEIESDSEEEEEAQDDEQELEGEENIEDENFEAGGLEDFGSGDDMEDYEKGLSENFDKLKNQKSEIDDNFFSLAQMEKYCDDLDEKEMNGEQDELDSELEDELYGDGLEDDVEDEFDDDGDTEVKGPIMYESFFPIKI